MVSPCSRTLTWEILTRPQLNTSTSMDVMAVWSSIKDHCSAEWGPEKMPYGMLEFAVKDSDGYLISFGQHSD